MVRHEVNESMMSAMICAFLILIFYTFRLRIADDYALASGRRKGKVTGMALNRDLTAITFPASVLSCVSQTYENDDARFIFRDGFNAYLAK